MDFDGDFGDDGDLGDYAAVFGEDENGINDFLQSGQDSQQNAQIILPPQEKPGESLSATATPLTENFDLPPVEVINLIAGFNTGCELDLRLITISARNIEYNPRKINAAILRLQEPKITAMLFQNGRVSICGARNAETAKRGGKIVGKLCQKAGHPEVRFKRFRIETLVCAAQCGFPVRLELLAKDHSRFCSYEPEIFCGLVWRHHVKADKKMSVLVFVSGKLIITGCKDVKEANEVYRDLYALLFQYRA